MMLYPASAAKLRTLAALYLLAFYLHAGSAFGFGFVYGFGDVFSGYGPASPTRPWVEATFEDVAPGTVRLTMANPNLSESENVSELYFNLNPAFDVADLIFTQAGTSGGLDLPVIYKGSDSFKADGDGKYDVLFSFSTGGMDHNRFTAGEYVSYSISGIAGLTATDFIALSAPAGGNGPFYAASHVQRIGPASESGWIAPIGNQYWPIPEPSALALFGVACGAGFLARRQGGRTLAKR